MSDIIIHDFFLPSRPWTWYGLITAGLGQAQVSVTMTVSGQPQVLINLASDWLLWQKDGLWLASVTSAWLGQCPDTTWVHTETVVGVLDFYFYNAENRRLDFVDGRLTKACSIHYLLWLHSLHILRNSLSTLGCHSNLSCDNRDRRKDIFTVIMQDLSFQPPHHFTPLLT